MNAAKREQLILTQLINFNSVSIEDIVFSSGVSQRTIYNDLSRIRNNLKEDYDIVLQKEGKIFYLKKEDIKWVKHYYSLDQMNASFNDASLKYQIIQTIIKNEVTTLQAIADEIFYSKSSVHLEMDNVERMLNKFNINLMKKPYYGISLEGQEKDIRFLIQYMISDQLFNADLNLEATLTSSGIISKEFSKTIEVLMEDYVEILNYDFLISLYVMYLRVKKNKHYVKSEILEGLYKDHFNRNRIQSILNKMKDLLKMNFNEDEIYYLLMNYDSFENVDKENHESKEIIIEINKLLDDKYGLINEESAILTSNLYIHIKAMLNRLSVGMVTQNPILVETKEQMPFAFSITADIALMLNDKFEITMNEEEIGLLSMHIQVLLDSKNKTISKQNNVVIVSHIGFSNTILLANIIKQKNQEINIIGRMNKNQANQIYREESNREHYTIISTCKLDIDESEYIIVNPLLNEADHVRIKEFIEKRSQDINRPKKSLLNNYMLDDLIYITGEFKDKESLISSVTDKMYELKLVSESFGESVVNREKLSSTYVINGVALPHGYSKHVVESAISIITLKNAVNWDGHYVKLIFICALFLDGKKTERKIVEEL